MKTLHFISLKCCFACIHVIVRFAHDYRHFVADNDYAYLFKSQVCLKKTCSLRCTCSGTGGSLTALKTARKHLQLSIDDNKKLIYCYKTFAFSDGTSFKDPSKQVIGVLKAGSTVNDIAHHFGCSRQTIHDLINRYNSTASVRVSARPGRARVTTLRPYRVSR